MKIRTLLVSAACIAACLAPYAEARSRASQPDKTIAVNTDRRTRLKGWRMVWSDEFDGTALDTLSWSRCSAGHPDWMRHMSPLDTLCRVGEGTLTLQGVCRPDASDDPRPYLTGGVQSRGKRSLRAGRVDVRARFDCAQGFWPAIWLMPDNDLPWPSGGEVDIMEHLNHDSVAYQTVHSLHTLNERHPRIQSSTTAAIDRDGFNVYTAIITDSAVEFYINGRLTSTYPRLCPAVADQYPFADHPFYVILSAQLGGSWVGEVDPAQLPVSMQVDYVRFYEKRE